MMKGQLEEQDINHIMEAFFFWWHAFDGFYEWTVYCVAVATFFDGM